MFCPKCGKKNEDNSLFCTWCGAGFGSVSTKSLSAAPEQEAPAPQPAELQTVPAAASSPSEPVMSAETPEAAPSLTETKQPSYSVPTPGVIPQSSPAAELSAPNAQAAPDSAANTLSSSTEVPLASVQKPEKERRYFTSAHIAICLAVAGVMAAAAGVFAGLYFSMIL